MTYNESYMMLETYQELLDEVERDIKIAMFMGNNPDRIERIRAAAEKSLNKKFNTIELDNPELLEGSNNMWDKNNLVLAINLLTDFYKECWQIDKVEESEILEKAVEVLRVQCNMLSGIHKQEDKRMKIPTDAMTNFNNWYRQALADISKPMPVVMEDWNPSECPRCSKDFHDYEDCNDGYYKRVMSMERCPFCGQKLDWRTE